MNIRKLGQNRLCGDKLNHTKICQCIMMLYFLVMTVVYPLYAPGGYMHIGGVKYEFFRNVSLAMAALMIVVILGSLLIRRDSGWLLRNYRKMSVTDWFAYGYLVVVMISYLCSAYKKDALWGVEGWYMGAVSQMLFIMIYFFFSRYFHRDLRWMVIWMLSTAAVFLLGICNRYSIYPIAMEGQTEGFISTLGNINWFCGYWSVTIPIGIVAYWSSDRLWVRILTGIYSVIAMVSGITQGSSSAYLVFIAMLLTLFILSLNSNRKLYRFLELCMMFAVSCQLGRVMKYLPGLEYNYEIYDATESMISYVLLDSNSTVWVFVILLVCYILFRALEKKGLFHIERYKWLWGILTAAVILVVAIAVFLWLFDNEVLNLCDIPPRTPDEDTSFGIFFDEEWGNGRGAAWNCGMEAYRSMDILHKVVGIGPDCFADYVYNIPELAEKLIEWFGNLRLTNAHSEPITLLVNTGMLGFVCYMGMLASGFIRYLKRAGRQPVLYLCAVSILTYTVHNLVSFQQVLNTPFIFIILGIGEKYYTGMMQRTTTEGTCDEQQDRKNS